MLIHVDHHSSRPVTRQVIEQIHWQIVSGTLRPGDRLPSIRDLSKQLGVNPTTITRIYCELASSGVIVLRQGSGAFVAESALQPSRDELERRVKNLARALLVEGLRHGMSKREIDRCLASEYHKIRSASHAAASH